MKKTNILKKLCMLSMAAVLVGTSVDVSMLEVQAASKITLTATKKTILTGQSFTLGVKKVKGLKNKKMKFKSSNPKVAKVAKSSPVTSVKITGKSAGNATITAVSAADNKTKATCKVTVKQGAKKVTLNATKATLGFNKSMQLLATVTPAGASPKVKWTVSNKKLATVSNKGVVKTKKKAGKVKVTATAADGSKKKAVCTITIKKKVTLATGVTLNATAQSLNVGTKAALKATIAPAKASNKNIYWTTSNAGVVSVDQKGNIVALKAGKAVITATANDGSKKKAACTVTVVAPSISLSQTTASVQEGNTLQLTARVSDALGTAVTWTSSNAAVATVAGGKVTAVKAGTAVITARSASGLTASCTVTVTAKPTPQPPVEVIKVTGVTLDQTAAELVIGNSVTLTATVAPENAENKNVTWTTSDAAVATVADGKVTAVAAGTADITVTTVDGGFTATCKVTVKAPQGISVTGVTLDKAAASIKIGESVTLTATVAPADADNKNVVWGTSDPAVATVANGKVTAVAAGTADITVTTEDGGFTATCKVTVAAVLVPATGITLDKTELKIPAGTVDLQTKLNAEVTPADTTDTVVWSSDSEVITVAEDGTVTVPANTPAGTRAVITATAGEQTASCSVLVTGKASALVTEGDELIYTLDKLAASVSAERKDISITKTQADIEQKLDEAKDYAEGILSGKYTTTQIVDKAWGKLVSRSYKGVVMTVTDVDSTTKVVVVKAEGKEKIANVQRAGNDIYVTVDNRIVAIRDITTSTNEDGTEGIVSFKVSATVNGKATLQDKAFTAVVSVSEDGLYSGSLMTDGEVLASCVETENNIVAKVNTAAADKAIAVLGSSRTVSSLLEGVSVNNIYE